MAMIFAVMAIMLSMISPLTATTTAQNGEWSAPRTVYIPETGHTLDQLFLDLWREAGGASSYGYPITPEITLDNGHIIQYLQYARFEYWPEGDENGNTVVLGNIGEELRPISLQRSVVSYTSTGATANQSSTATIEAAKFAHAWLPVNEPSELIDSTIRYVEATEHTVRGSFRDFWERTGEEWYLGNPLTEEYTQDGVIYQVFERGQIAQEQGGEPYLMPVGQILADKYRLDQEPVGQGNIPTYSEELFIPPPPPPAPEEIAAEAQAIDPNAEKWIDINLSTQYMVAYHGDVPVIESYVSTGRSPKFDTPPGTYHVNTKIDMQDMEGVLGGEYYNVEDVPHVMYFTNRGHAIHGAYWHNNFGAPMSHGCVNLPMDVAEFLYDWTPIGTRVEIHW